MSYVALETTATLSGDGLITSMTAMTRDEQTYFAIQHVYLLHLASFFLYLAILALFI